MAGRDKRYIDPMFYIPEGMDDRVWAYQETPDVGEEPEDEDFSDDFDVESDFSIIDESDSEGDDAPMAVDNLTIISQTLRRAQDGTQVVDIVAEVDDVPGATKYEFRITKI